MAVHCTSWRWLGIFHESDASVLPLDSCFHEVSRHSEDTSRGGLITLLRGPVSNKVFVFSLTCIVTNETNLDDFHNFMLKRPYLWAFRGTPYNSALLLWLSFSGHFNQILLSYLCDVCFWIIKKFAKKDTIWYLLLEVTLWPWQS